MHSHESFNIGKILQFYIYLHGNELIVPVCEGVSSHVCAELSQGVHLHQSGKLFCFILEKNVAYVQIVFQKTVHLCILTVSQKHTVYEILPAHKRKHQMCVYSSAFLLF